MWLIVIGLLIWAAVAGVLWTVLEIAIGFALGLFLFGVLVVVAGYFLVRRALNRRVGNIRTPMGPGSEGDIRRY